MVRLSVKSILVVGLLLPLRAFAQVPVDAEFPADTLAEVGGRVILARDLLERIELMPWPAKDNPRDPDSVKVKALHSLVAEQILAMDAVDRGLGNDSTLRRQEQNIEKLMVRDRLFRKDVSSRVRIDNREVREGLRRYAWNIRGLMLGTQSQADAEKLAGALSGSGSRDSIIAHPPTEAAISIDSISVRFGLLERSQEDAVYALSEAHPVSRPLNVPKMGWVVLSLLAKETNPDYAQRSVDERTQEVGRIIRRQKEAQEADRYSADLLAPRRAEAKAEVFELFARTIYEMLTADSLLYRNNSGYRLDFVVDAVKEKLKRHLQSILVDMDGGGLTIGEVLEAYRTLDFLLPNLNKIEVWRRLNSSVREIVAREYISREGYRQHLNADPRVRRDVETWANYWLASSLKGRILDGISVNDSEIVEYLVRRADVLGHSYEVNVREVLVDSLREAISILEKISTGDHLGTLAREFSKRKAWAERGGESGYFPVSDHPEIGFRALDADTTDIIGPVETPEGYSVFTVLGRRSTAGGTAPSFDSLKAEVGHGLLAEKVQLKLNEHIARAALRYHIKLHYNRLKRIEISPTNMVTRRFIGFGGTMLAVPNLPPLWDWIPQAKEALEILP